ncbi:MAG: TIGR04157 family glycosyltransferase [Prevotella sp.]|jgi:glycosyltransferase|nr:TIGR04157 family glycosyltransferase [Prevotella sp.]
MKEIYIINERSNAAVYGIGTFLREYTECLRSTDIKINVIELNSAQNEFQIKEEYEVKTYVFPYQTGSTLNRYYSSFMRICRLYIKDSDNLIFHLNYAHSEALIDLLRKFYPLSNILYTIHYQNWTWELNGDVEKYSNIIKKMNTKSIQGKYPKIIEAYKKEKSIYDKVDRLICLSGDTFQLLKNIYHQDESRIALIPNGIKHFGPQHITNAKKLKIKTSLFIEEHTKILLYVGRLDKLKGINSLISGFEKVVSSYPDTRLVIIGAAGDFSQSLKLTKKAASKITFTGVLSQKKLKQWYQTADIGIIPSYAEQCCYVGLEMMMYGLPIVASGGFGIRNMFEDGLNGKIAKIGSRRNSKEFEMNLVNAILELLASDRFCKKLSYNARKTYKDSYSLENMKIEYKKVFDTLNEGNINKQSK